jgi:ABC-type branched-subunit amino acid transport system substrate-binding protein
MVALAVALPSADARTVADPGISSDRILLGGTAPLTGPETAYAPVVRGADAYFRYVNSRGGVFGRKIEFRYLDDGYDPARTVQDTLRLVQRDRVFAIFSTIGTEHVLAVRPYLNAQKVPQLFTGSGLRRIAREHARYPWTMGYLPSFFGEGALYGRRIAATRPHAKVAVLYEASDYGRELLAGLRAGLGRKARIVATQSHDVTDTDVTSQVARLKRSKADTLAVFALPKHTILTFISTHKLGWRPQIYITSVSIDPAVMGSVRASTDARTGEGAITMSFLKDPTNPASARNPAVRLYRDVMRRFLPRADPGEVAHYYGMAVAYTMVDTLRKAGRNPTRAGVLRAATHLNEVNPFFRAGIPVQTGPNDYFPVSKVQMFRFRRGLWRPFGKLVDLPS